MRFDLLGFSLSRKENPPGVLGVRPASGYLVIFYLQIKRKVNPLNPFRRTNFSLLFIGKNNGMWHIEVLFIVFRNDQERISRKMFEERMAGQLRGKGKKFSDRVRAAGKW